MADQTDERLSREAYAIAQRLRDTGGAGGTMVEFPFEAVQAELELLLRAGRLAQTLTSILCSEEGQDPIERAKALVALSETPPAQTSAWLRSKLSDEKLETGLLRSGLDNVWRSIPPHDMVLHCPNCGKQHLDIGEFATRVHRKHLCENTTEGPSTGCGHLWVPFPYATRGVEQTKDATIDEMLEVFSTNPEEYRADPVGAMRLIEKHLRDARDELEAFKKLRQESTLEHDFESGSASCHRGCGAWRHEPHDFPCVPSAHWCAVVESLVKARDADLENERRGHKAYREEAQRIDKARDAREEELSAELARMKERVVELEITHDAARVIAQELLHAEYYRRAPGGDAASALFRYIAQAELVEKERDELIVECIRLGKGSWRPKEENARLAAVVREHGRVILEALAVATEDHDVDDVEEGTGEDMEAAAKALAEVLK
jgi:hypothetical protein